VKDIIYIIFKKFKYNLYYFLIKKMLLSLQLAGEDFEHVWERSANHVPKKF
jgi:hypothetical protein